MAGDVVLQSSPARRGRETVTDLGTEVSMMGIKAARLDWCVGVTTVSSSVLTSTPRTTAVNSLMAVEVCLNLNHIKHKTLYINHFRLGTVGRVRPLQQELWCGDVEQTQILQGSRLSTHHAVPAETL